MVIELTCRHVLLTAARSGPLEAKMNLDEFHDWCEWSTNRTTTKIPPDVAEEFVSFINEILLSDTQITTSRLTRKAIVKAVEETVKRSGTNEELSKILPDEVFSTNWEAHSIIRNGRSPSSDGNAEITSPSCITYHQMFGHPSSVQHIDAQSDDQWLLLQVFSDYGANMLFCDVGEINYFIDPKDLKNENFEKVIGTTCGG